MGSSSVTGLGQGSAEGPIRGLGSVDKILKRTVDEPAFKIEGQNVRSDIDDGGSGSELAEDIVVIPTGNGGNIYIVNTELFGMFWTG